METFKIEVKETLSKLIEIEANSVDEAIALEENLYNSEEIVLSANEHQCTDIDLSNLEIMGNNVEFSNFVLRKAEKMISNLSIEELSKIGFGNYSQAFGQFKINPIA